MEDTEEQVEEVLVYVKFNSMFDHDIFDSQINYKLIGLDTDEPVMQLGTQVFTGKWENSIGTSVFFEKDTDFKPEDPLFSEIPKTSVKYVCKVQKVLSMNRTILSKISDDESSSKDVSSKQQLEETNPDVDVVEDMSTSITEEIDARK